jgi:hypothetical protein
LKLEAFAKVLKRAVTATVFPDQARVANELNFAFAGSDDQIMRITKICFPALSKLLESSDEDPLKRNLRDAYNWWRYVSLCNQAREGYAVQYVNNMQLERARAAVKAIEANVTARDPSIDKDKIWDEATAPTKLTLVSQMCENALSRLLNASPVGAFTIPRP